MKVEHETRIDAPRPLVWSVTVDVERWPDWTPTVTDVARTGEGPFGVGSVARIRQPGLPAADWCVTSLVEGERFTWETRVRGLHMVATHELESSGTGTRNVLRVEFHGPVATLFWPLIRMSVRKALERENAGLKARCEGLAAEGHVAHARS